MTATLKELKDTLVELQRRKTENALNYYEPYGVMMLRFAKEVRDGKVWEPVLPSNDHLHYF